MPEIKYRLDITTPAIGHVRYVKGPKFTMRHTRPEIYVLAHIFRSYSTISVEITMNDPMKNRGADRHFIFA